MAKGKRTPGIDALRRDRENSPPVGRVKGGETPQNQRKAGHSNRATGSPVPRPKRDGGVLPGSNSQADLERTPLPEVITVNDYGEKDGVRRIGATEIDAPPEF